MATLQIENLPDELYDRIQSLAAQKNLSISEAAIDLLTQAVQPENTIASQANGEKSTAEILSEIRSRPRHNPLDFGLLDSTTLIREDRDR